MLASIRHGAETVCLGVSCCFCKEMEQESERQAGSASVRANKNGNHANFMSDAALGGRQKGRKVVGEKDHLIGQPLPEM